MPPHLDDAVVSPELALVDPELASRLRSSLPEATRSRPPAPPPAALSSRAGASARRPTAAIVLSAFAIAFLVHDGSFSEPVDSSPVLVAGATARTDGARPAVTPARSEPSVARAPSPPRTTPRRGGEAKRATPGSDPDTPQAPRARPGTRLSWAPVPTATSYDLVLVRGGRRIFAASAPGAQFEIPHSWTHRGAEHRIRPEDQAYVWAVVDGRRAGRPVVDGALALDLMLGVAFPS